VSPDYFAHACGTAHSESVSAFATLMGSLMAVAGIKDSLKLQGVRLTRQRQILLDLIDQSGQHLDAERLYELAREKDPKINRVTVYRTLKLLKAGGLVDELDLMHHEGDQHYYETRLKQEHAHVICLRCGKIRNSSVICCARCANRLKVISVSRLFWRVPKSAATAHTVRCCAPKNWPLSANNPGGVMHDIAQ
jgi:Fe2+ or Zn2+ uptake regulation protein